MSRFLDAAGREWVIKIDVLALDRIERATGINLVSFGSTAVETQLSNVVIMWRVLCAALAPQLAGRGITPEQFGESLDGQTAEDAYIALQEATINFFPPSKREPALNLLRSTIKAGQAHSEKTTEAMIEAASNPKLESILESIMERQAKNSGDLLTSLRGSSASTPATSPSVP